MRYVIGVDGGQTSTTAVLAEESGRLLGIGYGGPANHIHEPGGIERVRRSLADAIGGARAMAGLQNVSVACACLGMTGLSPQMEEICSPVVPADRLALAHDTRIALYSVTFGLPGVVVIGGTGSVGYGRNAQGETASTGGWGYLMGDEGSGYWIALRVLNACTRMLDGRGPQTQCLPLLLKRLGVESLRNAHRLVYTGALSRPDIAALAVTASEAAQQNDRIARHILSRAGVELGLLAAKVLRRLRMARDAVEVGAVGGVFRAGRHVLEPFAGTVHRAAPQAVILAPRVPAAVAAALLALEEIGAPVNEAVLAQVKATLPALGPVK
jgi:N-acetylglucosamine kinase-like BadF-type ATPase